MKFLLALCASFAVATSIAIGQATAATDSVEQQLTAKLQQMDDGLRQGNVPAYLAVAIPELIAIDEEDVFPTRQAFEQHLSKDIGAFRKISSFDSHLSHLQVFGEFARIDVTSKFVGDLPDKKDPAVLHHYVIELKFKQEWRHIHDDWRLTRFVQLGETGTVDGKAIPAHS